jgi:hypothetical protein
VNSVRSTPIRLPKAWQLCRQMLHAERARSAELCEALRALVESLPKCDVHIDRPATRAHERGGARYCDECGTRNPDMQNAVPEYPRAVSLRAAVALLERSS